MGGQTPTWSYRMARKCGVNFVTLQSFVFPFAVTKSDYKELMYTINLLELK